MGILMHVDVRGVDGRKVLYYSDGTVEERTSDWKLVSRKYVGRELTMLDMENMFDIIYEDITPKSKEKIIKERLKKSGRKKDVQEVPDDEDKEMVDEFLEEEKKVQEPEDTSRSRLALEREPDVFDLVGRAG